MAMKDSHEPGAPMNTQLRALQEATQMESRRFRASEARRSVMAHETQLQYSGRVIVNEDGNGGTADSFATTVGGGEVRYILIVANDVCRDPSAEPPDVPCPPPVDSISVTLNADVVLQTQVAFDRDRVEVALNPPGGDLNTIVITAGGQPGSAARVAFLAERPAAVFLGGLSILPWARVSQRVRTLLAVHNAGVAEVRFRIAFFNPDGSVAGRSAPQRLARHATLNLNLNEVSAALGLQWTRGAVHVDWAARGAALVSTVATEERRERNTENALTLRGIRTLPLDDYGPRPLTLAAAEELGF